MVYLIYSLKTAIYENFEVSIINTHNKKVYGITINSQTNTLNLN